MVLEGVRRRRAVADRPVALLGEIEIFRPFPPEAREYLGRRMGRRRYAAGETIVRQGDAGNSLFIIEEGVAMSASGVGWAPFDFTIDYSVDRSQRGALIVWTQSARDGSRIDIREYPVFLER